MLNNDVVDILANKSINDRIFQYSDFWIEFAMAYVPI